VNQEGPWADKELARQLLYRIRRWDPLGFEAIGAPPDEYDSAVTPIATALRRSPDPDHVAAAAGAFLREHYGWGGARDDDSLRSFAVELVELYRSRMDRPARRPL